MPRAEAAGPIHERVPGAAGEDEHDDLAAGAEAMAAGEEVTPVAVEAEAMAAGEEATLMAMAVDVEQVVEGLARRGCFYLPTNIGPVRPVEELEHVVRPGQEVPIATSKHKRVQIGSGHQLVKNVV